MQGTKQMLKQVEESANEKVIETQKIMENLQEKNDALEESLVESIEKVREIPETSETAAQTDLATKESVSQEIENLVVIQAQKRIELMRAQMMDASTETCLIHQEVSTQTGGGALLLRNQTRLKGVRVQTSESSNQTPEKHKKEMPEALSQRASQIVKY